MVRRTKEEAEATRQSIITTARTVFHSRGVSSTTLDHIATAAGVTRGAIYWHFANKHELFMAMRDQVRVPLLDRMEFELLQQQELPPLERIEKFMHDLLRNIMSNDELRTTFEIMTYKCEYVGAIEHELADLYGCHDYLNDKLVQVYRQAARDGSLRAGLKPELLSIDTLLFLFGLVRLWLIDESGTLTRKPARKLITAHIAMRRAN